MSGDEFVARLRHTDAATPVIMLTGETDRTKTQALIAAGINGFIRTPFRAEQICRLLEGVQARTPPAY